MGLSDKIVRDAQLRASKREKEFLDATANRLRANAPVYSGDLRDSITVDGQAVIGFDYGLIQDERHPFIQKSIDEAYEDIS